MLVLIFVAVVVDFKVVVVVKPTTGNVCVVPPVSAANKAEISLKIFEEETVGEGVVVPAAWGRSDCNCNKRH